MSARGTKRRSTRQAVDRKQSRSIYYEPDSDDSGEDDQNVEDDDLTVEYQPAPKRRKAKPQTRAIAQTRREPSRPRARKSKLRDNKKPKKKRLGAPLKPKTDNQTVYTGPSDNRVPDWASLPVDILRDVFTFAAQQLHEPASSTSTNWLLRSARTCRAFAIPALEAYYHCPAFLTTLQPHHLLELLQIPKDKQYIDYGVKVKRVEIDVKQIAYSANGRERFHLSSLVRLLPQLQDLEILHPENSPPYRRTEFQRWRYPDDLFHALDESGTRLKTWRWNMRFMPDAKDTNQAEYMSLAHTSRAFESLQRIVVCGCDSSLGLNQHQDLVQEIPGDREIKAPVLAVAISQLKQLKDLSLVSCDIMMDDFLEYLPGGLEKLEISNCLELTSTNLMAYLTTNGSRMRELILNHNSALDLAFLPQLKHLCPRLEVLGMDFTYYSERINYNDAWAMYDHVLGASDIPTWPTTLRHLSLVNMQKWEVEAARNLFQSLVHAAKDLPDLRHLVIEAHVDIPWRDRAQFRDKWIDKLNAVFLRHGEEPNPYLGSLRQYRLYKQAVASGRAVAGPIDLDTDDELSTGRRLSHVRITPHKISANIEKFDDPGPTPERPQTRARRSARVVSRAESLNASTAGDDDSSDDEKDSDEEPSFVQGLCHLVDIRIDNQRPAEHQFTEANFLDSEASGDEDWQSGAEEAEDGYAW